MAKKKNEIPVLEMVEGRFRLVEASGFNSNYDCRVLWLLNLAHPNSEEVKALENATGYSGGTRQFSNTVIKKLLHDGRAIIDSESDKVSITPIGRHSVYEKWPEIFQRQ